MRKRIALLTTTLLTAAPVAALAQPITGPYVSLGSGYNIKQNEGATIENTSRNISREATQNSGTYRWGNGFNVQASAGYGLGNGLRVELEGNYIYNDVNNFVHTPRPTASTGHQEDYGLFVNVLYDINTQEYGVDTGGVTPYVGVGVGYDWIHLGPLTSTGANTVFHAGGTNGGFAYQGIIGVAYPLPWVPGLDVTAEYRFVGNVNNGSYSGTRYGPLGVSKSKVDLGEDLNHQFIVGLRYAFYQPAPPPPAPPAPVAAPAPAPARTYLVFFDWDRADLTARARQIIAEAAQASTHVETTRIEVNGYTDLSGTAAYNQRLSVRRAQSVEAELVRDGVPRNEILIHGYGESNPLVPTAKGVREPQNRRVEIILH
ncbi:MAG TPA: OmpA family protein [Acetobacteraceae bacterium]|nr:OmpA family protein [Acetobacteraceae bacterium]